MMLTAAGVGLKTAKTIGGVLSAISTVSSLVGGLNSASAAEATAQRNAAQLEENARSERVMGSVQAARQRRRARQMLARQEAGFAESGALSGTAFGALDQSAFNAELDALTLQYEGDLRGQGYQAQADMQRHEGSQRGRALRAGAYGSALGGVMSFDPLNFGVDDAAVSGGGFLSRRPFTA